MRRFVFSSSCSTYGAAGDDLLDESAGLNPVTAYAESKVYVERDVAPLADDRFSPIYLRNATAYGASPRLRLDVVLNDLVACGVHHRPGLHQERRHAVAAHRAHPRYRGRGDGGARSAAGRRSTTPRSTWAGPKRTTAFASWPTSSPRQFPAAASSMPPAADPTSAAIASVSKRSRASCRISARSGPPARARRNCTTLTAPPDLTYRDLESGRYIRIHNIQRRLEAGELDSTLRPDPPGGRGASPTGSNQ